MQAPRVVLVTDLDVVGEEQLFDRIARAATLPLELRARLAVQLREPEMEGRAKAVLGARLREATRAIGAKLVVNDRLDLAKALGADGVHLGRRSVSVDDARAIVGDAFVTRACHDVDEVVAAAREGADGALLSPIFASPNKGAPLGLPALGESVRKVQALGLSEFAVLALGGVDAMNAGACFDAGASGVAVVRADLTSVLEATLGVATVRQATVSAR